MTRDAPSLYAGIDVGSTTVKGVAMDEAGRRVGAMLVPASGHYSVDIARVLEEICADGCAAIVATGYGADLVPGASRTVTEISCHARGIHLLSPEIMLLIDVGGQDSKVISVGKNGRPVNFEMNDKCAAGTGRFLEVMARSLGIGLSEMSELAVGSASPARITSMCTVFAESEVIGLLARGTARADIVAGIIESASERIVSLAARLGCGPPVAMTGGAARNAALVAAIARRLSAPVLVPDSPELCGALGAADIARVLCNSAGA